MTGSNSDVTPGDYGYYDQSKGYWVLPPARNFTPPSRSPNYFTRSNIPGSQSQHAMSPANYDQPGTQTAQVPQPGTNLRQLPGYDPSRPEQIDDTGSFRPQNASQQSAAPTPGNYTPAPWRRSQEPTPLVPPTPTSPPQQPPIPPPAQRRNNPYWMSTPRGEPARAPFQQPIQQYAQEYGIPPILFNALIRAESGYNPNSRSTTGAMGLGQLEPGTAREMGVTNPYDPDQNLRGAAQYLRQMYDRYGSWAKAVSAYNRGPGGAEASNFSLAGYQGYGDGRELIRIAGSPLLPAAGGRPPQNYRPASYTPRGGYPSMIPDRPPSMWGKDPDFSTNMPHQREIPGIIQGLLPLLTIGLSLFARGAALPMISFYSGYLKAQTARQDEDAKLLRTQYQDKLKETTAKLKLEQEEAAGALGNPDELRAIAAKYGDSQLRAALDSGNPKAVEQLFQARDRAFQDLSKTDLAERRFDLEMRRFDLQREENILRDKRADARDDRERKRLDDQLEKNREKQKELERQRRLWGGGRPTGDEPDEPAPSTEPPSETPEPAPGRRSEATPAPTTEPTTEPTTAAATGGEDVVVDAQGNPIPKATDVTPVAYRGPVTPIPAATPGAPSAAPPPTPLDTKAADFVMGNTDLTGIPKEQQAEVQLRSARIQQQLNDIPKNLQGRQAVDAAVRRINPQMADTLENLLNYRTGMPSGGATSGGQGGRMNPFWQRMASLAGQADPSWNPERFHMYAKQRDDFAGAGKMAVTLARSNRLLSASAAVLQAANDLGQNVDENKLQTALEAFNATGIMGDPQYTRLAAAWRNFALESTAVSQGGIPPVTTSKALMDMVPIGATLRQIRAAVKTDIYSSIGSIDTARQVWNQLPENQGRPSEPLGFIREAYDGLNIIGSTLDVNTGQMSNTYTDEQGQQHTVTMPHMLREALPKPAPATAPHTDSGGWSITPVPVH